MKNLFVFGLLASTVLFGAGAQSTAKKLNVNPQPAPTTTAEVPAQNEGMGLLTGTLDLRPTYSGESAVTRSENYVDIGFKKDNFHLIYEQDFNTNIFDSTGASEGLNLSARHGFFRAKFDNLYQSADKDYSFSYEFRPFVPVYGAERDKGFITILRNYAKFSAKMNDTVTLSVWEAPAFHFYETAGQNDAANASFQNRVYLMADVVFTKDISLNFPLLWYATKFRNFEAAPNSGAWDHYVWINPELDYALTSNYTLGLAWYNDRSFLASDLSGFALSDGFKSGVAQIVFRASL